MKKRLLSLILCLVMVFSLFPSFAMAAEGDPASADPAGSVYSIVAPGTEEATNPETASVKYEFYDSQGTPFNFDNGRSYQYVGEGGTLYFPGVPANADDSLKNPRFIGWWTKDDNGNWDEQVLNPDTDTAGKTISGLTGTSTVRLYARYSASYYLIYQAEDGIRVVAQEIYDAPGTVSLKNSGEWRVDYTPDSADKAFLGWSTQDDATTPMDSVTIDSHAPVKVYPVLVQAKWIHFTKNDKDSTDQYAAKGATATFTAPVAVQTGHTVSQDHSKLDVPEAPGYTFLGWWNGNTQWTDGTGAFVNGAGNQTLNADVDLFALWQA